MGNDTSQVSVASQGEIGIGGDGNPSSSANTMNSIRLMDEQIRQRVRHGIQYNLRMIIRGAKRSGKTMLWKRLQGFKFEEKYEETREIQAATIDWCYKSFEDSVKVEVWDIVDRGLRNTSPELCAKEIEADASKELLDAQKIDVYRGTNAVIVTMSPFSIESLEYARKEAHRVPSHIAIIFLLNFRDLVEAKQYPDYYSPYSLSTNSRSSPQGEMVRIRDVYELVNEIRQLRKEPLLGIDTSSPEQQHQQPLGTVYAVEVSLLNCWGLIELDRFFNIPFLLLKKQSLLDQLSRTESDLSSAATSLSHDEISWNQLGQPVGVIERYNLFTEKYSAKRGAVYTSLPPAPAPLSSSTTETQIVPTIHQELQQIIADDLEKPSPSSALSNPSPTTATSTSLQLKHLSSPSPALSSPPSTPGSHTVIAPQDDSPPLSPSPRASPVAVVTEGDLDLFIPSVDQQTSRHIDDFFAEDNDSLVLGKGSGRAMGKKFISSDQRSGGESSYEGDASSSSLSPSLPPTPEAQRHGLTAEVEGAPRSLVRIKKKNPK